MDKKFKVTYINGEKGVIYLKELEDKVEEWHNLKNNYEPLHKFLKMSWKEYKKFVKNEIKYV